MPRRSKLPSSRARVLIATILVAASSTLTGTAPGPAPAATAAPAEVVVFPEPQELTASGASFPLPPVVRLVRGQGADAATEAVVVDTLREAGVTNIVRSNAGEEPGAPLTVWLGTVDDPSSSDVLAESGLDGHAPLPADGYAVAAGPADDGHRVALVGQDANGAFYAAQTFRQLVQPGSGRSRIAEVRIRDWPTMGVRGVIEGFYGDPWSQEERLSQIAFYAENKMNTYVYAPKDDPYHRDRWREPYPEDDLADLASLTQAAARQHVDLVWTLSPGLDICYSSDEDFELITEKAQAVWDAGVRDFALLFDDIFPDLTCAEDEARFGASASPAAAAQAHVLNRFAEEFLAPRDEAGPLITVPTEYYQQGTSPYRETFAELVDPQTLVYWTGNGITTATVTVEDAARTREILGHDLLLWDNYPANDFARGRIFLGPLTGRAAQLTEAGVRGVTANPMEHAEASKLPLATVADYTWNAGGYDAERSWDRSLQRLGGEHAGALRTFAENALSSPLRRDESPVLTPLIGDFLAALGRGDAAAEGAALITGFADLEEAARLLHDEFGNEGFVAEMNPWLDKAHHLAVAGQLATSMLLAQQAGDAESAARLRTELDAQLARDLTDVTVPVTRQASRALDGVNVPRGSAELIMYTPEYGATTKTNQWGYEVTVVEDRVVAVSGNNSPIPADGYVLSVHSAGDGDWLRYNALVGSTVVVDEEVATLTTAAGTYDVPNLVSYARGVAQPFLDRAVRENDGWLGGRDEAGPFSTLPAYGDYGIDRMADGDLGTFYWSAGAPKVGDYVGVDLGEVTPVARVEVHMASTSGPAPRPSDYLVHGALQVSADGSRWTTVGEYRDQPEIVATLESPIPARFVRLQALTSQTGWIQVREFIAR